MIYEKIKQIFCKHDWAIYDSYRFSQRLLDGSKQECLSYVRVCAKCGKIEHRFEHS